jgi:class 3 adenylate cyclase
VNLASRLEARGLPDRIHVSEATRRALGPGYVCKPRGLIDVKGMGKVRTAFLTGRKGVTQPRPLEVQDRRRRGATIAHDHG